MNTAKSKHWLLHMCVCLLLLAGLPDSRAATAQAESAVQLSVTAGIGGDYKEAGMVPVQVTVSNGGADVEGNLVVAANGGNGDDFSVGYYQPVSVAKGATKQVTITVRGDEIGPHTYVALMQGDDIVAKTSIGGRRHSPDTLFVGVLAADPDTANFLGAMPQTAFPNPVRVVPMKAEQFPAAKVQLEMIDILVLNNFALDGLNGQQVQAIRDWTASGGMLVLAGGAHYNKTAGALADLSPVEVTGVTSLATLSSLAVEKNKPLVLEKPFTVSTANLKTGSVVYAEGGVPLMAVRSLGEGKVLYVAYDLAEEPVASWSGNGRFWAEALTKAFGAALQRTDSDPMNGIWGLNEAADRIPSLKLPDVKWMALFFGCYALLAGPVFFYLLRRKRKQGYMWVAVPVFAVITGAGIFSYGALQRGTGALVHQTGFVQLQGDGQARIRAITALFVPTSGDYELEVKGGGKVWPILYRYGDEASPQAWVSMQSDRTLVQFRDVEFWSMRKVGTEQVVTDAGSFVSDLVYADGALKGTVTNKTRYALRDVVIVSGGQVQKVPELAPGSSVQVNLPFNPAQTGSTVRPYRNNRVFLPSHVDAHNPYETSREGVMINDLEQGKGFQPASLMLVGWTRTPAVETDVKNRRFQADSLTLVTQPLSLKPSPDGYVVYPAGTIVPVKTGSSVKVEDQDDGYMMQAGDITLDFPIEPGEKRLKITNIYLYTWSNDNTRFDKQVYNWKTHSFDPFDKAFANNTMTGDKTPVYLSPDGTLRIRFSHGYNDYRHLGIPVISVEGKVMRP
ncbi:hypothetical protein FOI68_10320 [Brevibacillus sp. LEMMJ03]|uniref:DUF7408 domain-containing protein n=1 Tax=Brevibacillus sp. LEMMJ03 TaxID=2595056 RepID=UPI00117F1442|nr:hypothetical protein [Brevibacillus sp. LEMMJ03]TRY26117.1 hypothetical protein FOI68_10320 [Brevibacillus sp. LEMMJ03]